MSDFARLIVIIAVLVVGQLSIFYCATKLHDRSDVIAAGVAKGVRLSTQHRRMLLFNTFTPVHYMLSVYALLLGVGLVLVSRTISDQDFRLFGYLIALYAVVSGVGLMAFGTLYIIHLASVLRQAEAD